ncbi:MAG: hypothetical protein IPG45_06550 [Deltaproteobacteria bacterium]|nr:hypothetical protein [Deltaproteobacteria bacterium]
MILRGITWVLALASAPAAEVEILLPPREIGICVSGGSGEDQRAQLFEEAAKVVAARRGLSARRVNLPSSELCDRARLVSCWARRLESEPPVPDAIVWLSIESGLQQAELTAAYFTPGLVLALDDHQSAAELEAEAQATLHLLEPVPWSLQSKRRVLAVDELIGRSLAALGLDRPPPVLLVRHDCAGCRLHLDGHLLSEAAPKVLKLVGVRAGRRQITLSGADHRSAFGEVEVGEGGAELQLSVGTAPPPAANPGGALAYGTVGAGGVALILSGLAVMAGASGPDRSCVAAPCGWRYARLDEDRNFSEASPGGVPPLPLALGAAVMAAAFGVGWWQGAEVEWPYWLAGVILGAGVAVGALLIEPAGASRP